MAISFIPNKISDIQTISLNHQILTDEPLAYTSDFRKYTDRLSEIIVNSKPRFTVGIYGGWGTGKTTMMQMIQDNLNKKYGDKLETIWFDSWRYEREKYSAMIPLLRTIILTLEKAIINSREGKARVLKKLQKGFVKMIKAIINNTTLNVDSKIGNNLGAGVSS